MPAEPKAVVADLLARLLDAAGASRLEELRAGVAREGGDFLERFLACLPRRLGRDRVAREAVATIGGSDPASWRVCDLAAADLLARALRSGAPELHLEALFAQGDAEERRMILKSLPVLGDRPETPHLLDEAHRSNDQILFEAGLVDTDLPARRLADDAYGNMVLKAAFLDIPLERLPGAQGRARAPLSATLLDFMSEREAAGRPVWAPTLELAAEAPCAGVLARTLGDLWSGVDRRRLAAARSARKLASPEVRAFLRERLKREPLPLIRREIEAALGSG